MVYLEYFYEVDYYNNTAIAPTGGVQTHHLSTQAQEFRKHIHKIGALDLTDYKNYSKIPTTYWKIAIICNTHLFQPDLDYIKNTLYSDPVFNLVLPLMDINHNEKEFEIPSKLIIAHEHIYSDALCPNGLKNVVWYYLGDMYESVPRDILELRRPYIETWFDLIRNR